MEPRGSDRRGSSTVEVLVSVLLMALLVQLSWSLLSSARRATERLIQRSEATQTERLGWHVLSREVGAGLAARDWSVEGGKVLPLRAFRGVGEVCPPLSADDGAVMRYEGMRLPEPSKDSLLALTADGEWRTVKLTSRAPSVSECPLWPGELVERWHWEPALQGVLLARVFERGSYNLGDAGRQPLTAERLESGSSLVANGGGVSMRLRVRVDDRVVWDTKRTLAGEGTP
jgi:hypothetical protein